MQYVAYLTNWSFWPNWNDTKGDVARVSGGGLLISLNHFGQIEGERAVNNSLGTVNGLNCCNYVGNASDNSQYGIWRYV